MLKTINTVYIFASLFLYFTLSPKITGEHILVNILAIFSFMCYFIMLELNRIVSSKYNTYSSLAIEVFVYSFIFVFLENSISYFYTGNFFVFSTSDATFYHDSVMEIIDMPLMDGINHYLSYMDFDDLGMILVLYPLCLVSDSNLMLNLFYLFVGVIIATSLFSLSQQFMSKKYAFLASLSFSISSFIIFFHSSGLKESFLVMIVVLSFDFYYRFLKSRKIRYLLIALIFLSIIMLFRPAILGMVIVAVGSSALFSQGGAGVKIISFFIFIFLMAFGDLIGEIIEKYTTGGVDTLIEARETQGMVIGGVGFTYAVNILSQSIGPLPTVVSSSKILTMLYTSGLIYRVFLGIPFWLTVLFAFRYKYTKIYPLILFVIMEMSALAFLMDGLELRKALPHIPIVYVVAFWFLDRYDRKIIQFKKEKRFEIFFKILLFILIVLMFYWNFR